MRNSIILFITWLSFGLSSNSYSQYQIIPTPEIISSGKGNFNLTQNTYILANDFDAFVDAATFKDLLYKYYQIPIKTSIKPLPSFSMIEVQYDSTLAIPTSGYILDITTEKITVTGKNNGGVFYGLMSLMQCIPLQNAFPYNIPVAHIEDYPAFSWRGMHLDVSRHFFTVDEVKRYIDILALYKMNVFHWHLTDDQGWRIEIKKYPKLTEVGAYRSGSMIGHYNAHTFDSIPYGGYYTQAEIKEVVKYAAQRNITIVPEIEMPGHALAMLAAYPELSCTGGPFEVGQEWGVYEDILCPKEETFIFLENVLDEVMQLFPSEYIHIGGDEAPKIKWDNDAFCKKLMQEKNIADTHELQSYFIQRIEKYVNSKGRKIIGWDEILEGGLAPNAAVMSWQGMEGGTKAANEYHYVVMSPTSHCYFDYYQSDLPDEPLAIGGYLPIEKVYAFDPIPTGLSDETVQYILGGQGNMWSEYLYSFQQVEYMLLPRLAAMAEVLWSYPEEKDFSAFSKKVLLHFHMYDKLGFNYSKAILNVFDEIYPDYINYGLNIILKSNDTDAQIFYTIDGSKPTKKSTAFKQVISVDSNTVLRAITLKDSIYGPELKREFSFSKFTAAKVQLQPQADPKYNVHGEFTLVNGVRGQKPWKGSDWLGFQGADMEAVIDPGKKITISKISAGVLQDKGSWIYLPVAMEVYTSMDGTQYDFKGFLNSTQIENSNGDLTVEFSATEIRYVKIVLRNAGEIPVGNSGAGFKAWLFVDEVLAY